VKGPGPVRIVARREFVERIRDRGFLISTGITLLILVVFIGASAMLGRGTRFDLGVVGDVSRPVGEQVVDAAAALDIEVTLTTYPDAVDAERAVRDGDLDAVLVHDTEVVVRSDARSELIRVIQVVSARDRSESALREADLSQEQIDRALNQPPLPVRALEPLDERRREYAAVAIVGVLALYGQLFAYGYWVAAGVVEEKSSRVIEVLLATVRPSQLLRGKIVGIGLLGLFQLFVIGAIGLGTAALLGALRFPAGAIATMGIVLVWFVLGFFFYATLFAVAGAIVPRQEDLQSTMTPLSIVIILSLFVGISAVQNPDSTLAVVASMFPPSAPLVMPSRLVLGQAPTWQGVLSALLCVAATMALVPLATRVYSRAVLRTGKVRIRQVLRADRRS
jgi:ABC-2 type transport system permease protein